MDELLDRMPPWMEQYEESISIEDLRIRKSNEENADELFLGPSWAKKPADKLADKDSH